MKLGEMLVRDGHVTAEQVDAAIAKQAADGGRMGTVLVELGFVDLETLTVYLGLELGLPIATGAMLDRAKRTAVRLLAPNHALQFRCVPLLIAERQLVAAVDDPHDLATLEELGRLTGYRIIPRVAPEIRIYYYLERYYGVPRPERYRVFGDAPRGNRRGQTSAGARLPGPSLPGLPPRADHPVAAPTPAPVLRAKPPEEPSSAAEERRGALESEAASLVVELEADAAETAEQAPPAEAFEAMGDGPAERHGRGHGDAGDASALGRDEPSAAPRKRSEAPAPQGLDECLRATRSATQRGEVADALMTHARQLFDVGCLLIVRDNLAFGWKGFGPELSRDRLEAMLIPLDAPSMFHAALHESEGVFAGSVVPSVLHRHLYKVLRTAPPRQAVVGVVRIGRRAVSLVYGHRTGRALVDDADLDGLRALVKAAAEAYVRLIALAKTPEPA